MSGPEAGPRLKRFMSPHIVDSQSPTKVIFSEPKTSSPITLVKSPTFITKISLKQANKLSQKLHEIGEDSGRSID